MAAAEVGEGKEGGEGSGGEEGRGEEGRGRGARRVLLRGGERQARGRKEG